MNNRVLIALSSITIGAFFVSSCGDTSTFKTPNTSATLANDGLISQKNFTILFSETKPKFLDLTTGEEPAPVTSEISVQIGDNKNQLITGSHTIHFKTEWGLIDPSSCTTADGGCSVTWSSGSFNDMPANYLNNILAYSVNGQETFKDIDGNGFFNDGDTFEDLVEPFIDANESGSFDAGDFVVDTINGIDPGGKNALHDAIDGLYNGPNCTHTSLCSTSLKTSVVWESGSLDLTGGTFGSGGGGGGSTFANITLNSHIPAEILDPASPPNLQTLHVDKDFIMGNSNSQIFYVGRGANDIAGAKKLYRAENIGQTDVPVSSFSSDSAIAISADSTKMAHTDSPNNIFIFSLPVLTSIGIGPASPWSSHISLNSDGSLLTFIDANNLTGNNPGNFMQVFTLTTDGNDTLTQVSNFTAQYIEGNQTEITFSGNGNIVFHSDLDVLNDGSHINGTDEIFSIATDGSNLKQWSNINKSTGDITSIKSDDSGSTIAFTFQQELHTINTATTATTLITEITLNGIDITDVYKLYDISADGSAIVYAKIRNVDANGNAEVLILSNSPDGTNETQLWSNSFFGTADSNGAEIFSLETSSNASSVTFMSSFDFGKTVADEHQIQIYTLTP